MEDAEQRLTEDAYAEQAIIGIGLLDPEALASAVRILAADDFVLETHRIIWAAICHLYDAGSPVDLVTVREELRRTGGLRQVGGAEYLIALVCGVPTPGDIAPYVAAVRRAAGERRAAGRAPRRTDQP